MGIINTFSSKRRESTSTKGKGEINNRRQGPEITPNRKVLFKKFNYQFRFRPLESVAS